MKAELRFLVALTFAVSTPGVLAQGTVDFKNRVGVVDAPFFDDHGERLDGAYLAQLYAWKKGEGFQPVGSATPFKSKTKSKGYFSGGSVAVPFIYSGVWVQVRAWESDGGATFEEAALAGAWTGGSNIVFLRTGGGGSAPMPPAHLFGLKYPGAPIIVRQPESQTIQARAKVTLSVVASSGVKARYQWYQELGERPDGLILGATSPTYLPPPLKQDTTYWVTVSNSAGTVTSERAKVTVLGGGLPWLRFSEVNPQHLYLALEGKPGATYEVQYTENIGEPVWLPLKKITLWGSGRISDKFDPLRPARFYRAVELP